jgi:DNA-binding XRE family transcriptional regulator
MTTKIKELRNEKRLTQEELSMRSGVSRQTIVSIENDPSYNVTYKTLNAIAGALGVTVDQLFLP